MKNETYRTVMSVLDVIERGGEPDKSIKRFVDSLYTNGKKPCERFGMTWEELSSL